MIKSRLLSEPAFEEKRDDPCAKMLIYPEMRFRKKSQWISGSADETFQIGKAWGATLKSGAVIAFSGDLGAGKTTFIRGIADSFAIDTHSVSSPTFTYLNVYSGSKTLFHFDLYRIKDAKAFLAAGFDDFLQEDAICCIEWAERIDTLLKESIYRVSINIVSEEEREICIRS